MAKQIIQGTTEINSSGIKNHFVSVEPVQAILELVWNGFDAGAKNININIVYDHFNTVKNLTILDDGDGINFTDLGSNFNRFNDSLKKQALINTVLKVEGVYHFISFVIKLTGILNIKVEMLVLKLMMTILRYMKLKLISMLKSKTVY